MASPGAFNRCIVRRIFTYVLLTSLAVGLLAAALLFTWTYHTQQTQLEQRAPDIHRQYGAALAHALWQYDRQQLTLLLAGMQSQGDLLYVRISDNISLTTEVGSRPYHGDLIALPVDYDGQRVGTLELGFDRHQPIWTALTIATPYLISLGTLLMVLAGTLVLVLHKVVTQRVTKLVKAIECQLENGFDRPISIEPSTYGDDLDRLVNSFRLLNDQLINELIRNKQTRQQLSIMNTELEQRVEERTQHLSATIDSLNQALDDLKATQKQLIDAEKLSALGGMIAGIGHEIETPLGLCLTMESCLRNDVRMLRSALAESQDPTEALAAVTESLDMLQANLNRASELMKSFKSISAPQIGEDNEWINLHKVIEQLLYTLSPTLRDTEYQLNVDCPETLSMQGSASAISQIFTNLIMNSLHHGFHESGQGSMTLRIREDRDQIIIHYADNGSGLSPEAQEKIFEPLYTTRRHKGGTGLGMHLVYNIVNQQMKGDIALEPVSTGVAFRIAIPKRKATRREKGRQAIY